MIISRLRLKNWRNFSKLDVLLRQRQFIVGPNASGKSNLLDVFRFLRDIAKSEGGGLQKAVKNHGGLSKIRCLSARRDPEIIVDVELAEAMDTEPVWCYSLGIDRERAENGQFRLSFERVWKKGRVILDRPNQEDENDPERLQQTFLEQINTNGEFREIVRFFDAIGYVHLIPQLLRHTEFTQGGIVEDDPFGQGLLLKISKTDAQTRTARLNKLEEALKITVPQLQQLRFERVEETG
ncbi:MAG: chromosome segregation protein SMC, partial [Candidatus Electrothrix sp. MAN1_4]|nr:chromosome segregation protein SMC [Candidatus Electrothrix sp. MAN1_4]